jgi:S-DNA-T family DNA segregation ATPase FtsK/SpoIIIE
LNQKNQIPEADNTTRFMVAIFKLSRSLLLLTYHGLPRLLGIIWTKPGYAGLAIASAYSFIRYGVLEAWHLRLLAWLWPAAFHGKFLDWLYSTNPTYHYKTIFFIGVLTVIIVLGSRVLMEKARIQESFEAIGLKNALGVTPKLVSRKRNDQWSETYVFHANSVSLEQWEAKRSSLETVLNSEIESITRCRDLNFIAVKTTTKTLPNFVSFKELASVAPPLEGSFFVGDSKTGLIMAKLEDLPHLLIAGTTGGGKSVFFKQVISCLLKSTSGYQFYLIDLKRGLEAKDFSDTPNVAIAKDIHEAVLMLEAVHREMEKRFKYLEQKGFKKMKPERDLMDRLVVAVDEAGELYAEKSKFDDDYDLSQRAQKITNSLARLGRAAGIHLILATQKVNKESINTIIQENISARLCFKMNTLQGSLQMLGSKDALDLPSTPGRAIWQHGLTQTTVQVPYLEKSDIEPIKERVRYVEKMDGSATYDPMLIGPNSASATDGDGNNVRDLFVDRDV